MRRVTEVLAAVIVAGAVAGCSVEDSARPTLTGPSEFALSVTLTAAPDQLPPDGASQSVITVTVRDASGRPVEGQRLSVSTNVGTLSASQVVTSSGGQASFAFTAPASGASVNAAVISVLPVGTSAGSAVSRTVTVLLTTGAPNRTVPTPSFTVTPTNPERNVSVRFDASGTTDEGAACLDACTYSWSFGDGSTANGRIVNHTFTASGTFTVTLTVTDAAGSSASTARTVTISVVAAPTVTIAVSPNPPLANQQATFTATTTAATGHSVVLFNWDFGDGTTQVTTSPTVTKTFSSRGTFVVTVTVIDDLGQTASSSLQVIITGAGATASFTVSPTNPEPGQSVRFDGSDSTGAGGAAITKWTWDFGDGSSQVEDSAPTTSHAYAAAGKYVVRLTVTDSGGRTGSKTGEVTVAEPE
jgi:PKD repeat protein